MGFMSIFLCIFVSAKVCPKRACFAVLKMCKQLSDNK